jgi:hypothetical protein
MKPTRSCCPLGVVTVTLTLGVAHATTTYHPAVAISDPMFKAISVTGTDFGAPQAGSSATLSEGATTSTVPSTDRAILVWTAGQIVVKVPPATHPASIAVTVGGSTTPVVPIQYYVYDWFEANVPPDPGGNALPLAIAVDKSRVWISEEFHFYAFKMIDQVGRVDREPTQTGLQREYAVVGHWQAYRPER